MTQIIDGTIFIVDSSQALTGTAGNFTYILNFPKNKEYTHVCLLQAILPKSYYLVTAPFNTMTLSEPGMSPVTVTITPGNYNAISWTTLIAAQLTAASPHGWTYTITFPKSISQIDTGLFTYTVAGNGGVQPSFISAANTTSTVYEQFGFSASSTNTFVGNNLISSNVIKFQLEDTLFIHSDLSYNNDQSTFSDVLQEIYSSSTPTFTNIIYQNSGAVEAYSKILLNNKNNVYHFSVTDEHGLPINFNGLNCVFTILLYKKENLANVVKKYLQRSVLMNPLE